MAADASSESTPLAVEIPPSRYSRSARIHATFFSSLTTSSSSDSASTASAPRAVAASSGPAAVYARTNPAPPTISIQPAAELADPSTMAPARNMSRTGAASYGSASPPLTGVSYSTGSACIGTSLPSRASNTIRGATARPSCSASMTTTNASSTAVSSSGSSAMSVPRTMWMTLQRICGSACFHALITCIATPEGGGRASRPASPPTMSSTARSIDAGAGGGGNACRFAERFAAAAAGTLASGPKPTAARAAAEGGAGSVEDNEAASADVAWREARFIMTAGTKLPRRSERRAAQGTTRSLPKPPSDVIIASGGREKVPTAITTDCKLDDQVTALGTDIGGRLLLGHHCYSLLLVEAIPELLNERGKDRGGEECVPRRRQWDVGEVATCHLKV
eukprot:scaffold3960_cov116-Isochrysis_galbana.AAC.11